MAPEKLPSGPENEKFLSFDQLTQVWYGLKDGEQAFYVVCGENGKPLESNALPNTQRGFVLLNIRAERKHILAENGQVEPSAELGYTAYEWVTNFDDADLLEAYWDLEYFEKKGTIRNRFIERGDFLNTIGTPDKSTEDDLKESTVQPPEPAENMNRRTMMREEITRSASEYLHETSLLLQTTKFRRIQRGEVIASGIVDAVKLGDDKRLARAMEIIRGKQSFYGENVLRSPKDPMDLAQTIVIRVWLANDPMKPNELVARFEGRKNRITALRAELENPESELMKLLVEQGYEQVRLEVGSWRERTGEKYELHIPVIGVNLRKPQTE